MKRIKREGQCPDEVHGGAFLWRCVGHVGSSCYRVPVPMPKAVPEQRSGR